MQLSQIPIIVNATTMIVIGIMLLLIRNWSSRPGVDWWIAASVMQATCYGFAMMHFWGQFNVGIIVFYFLTMCIAQFLSIGVLLFKAISLNIIRRLLFLTLSICVTILLVIFDYLFLASLSFAIYSASSLFHTVFCISHLENISRCFNVIKIMMCLMAIHWLDFPFLSQVEWFIPIGFIIGSIIIVGLFLSLTIGALGQFKEQIKDSEQHAIDAATIDSLTGLYNRSHLPTLFNNYGKEADQLDRSFILLYIDLDGFKQVNDKYGHAKGDLILKTVATRMSLWLGSKGDVIRIGGDELIVLASLRGIYHIDNAVIAAQKLLCEIEKPIIDGGTIYNISASIGGCRCGSGSSDNNLDQMLSRTDKLMYAAKESGGKCVFFSNCDSIEYKVSSTNFKSLIA